MVDITRPNYGTPWAAEGEVVAPTQDKMDLGWVQEMMPFQWENYLQNRQDRAITYLLQKGIPEYSETQEYIAQKSVVLYTGAVYIATQTVTGVAPTVAASWKRISTVSDVNGTVTVAGGGTGATTAEDARTNLGLGSAALLSSDVVVQKDSSGNFSAGIITASLAGNATSSDKLKVARTVQLTGLVTSTPTPFDGSSNLSVPITSIDATGVTVGTLPVVVLGNAVTKTSQTGSAVLPSGTTFERDSSPQEAYFRYNKTTKLPEFYDGTSWKSSTGLNTGNFVSKTSDTGAAVLPAGTEAQRPSAPPTGLNIRLNLDSGKPEWYNPATSEWQALGSGGGYMFERNTWGGTRATIPLGFIPRDGDKLYRSQYPDAYALVMAGAQKTVPEADWQADPLKRGMWSTGDNTVADPWVRLPDSNGVQAGSIGGLVEAGDYGGTRTGQVLGDAFQGHVMGAPSGTSGFLNSVDDGSGTLQIGTPGNVIKYGAPTTGSPVSDGLNGDPRTASETRAKTEYGVKIIRVFMDVTSSGTTDITALLGQVADLGARQTVLDNGLGCVLLYPNGTSTSPASITTSQRIEVVNPWPNFLVGARVELLMDGVWSDPMWYDFNSASYGVRASQNAGGGNIFLRSGVSRVGTMGLYSGSASLIAAEVTTAPVRVWLWKEGKIPV